MLDWLDDIDLRRRTNANLNKGEARNALARAVFFNRLGEIRDRTFENQRHRASGLNLVSASIILWNTVYLGRAADYLRRQGRDIDDALLSHEAPLGWEPTIGRASCRERVCQYRVDLGGRRNIKKHKKKNTK